MLPKWSLKRLPCYIYPADRTVIRVFHQYVFFPQITFSCFDWDQSSLVQKKSLSSGTKKFPTSISTFFFPSFMSWSLMIGATSSPKLRPLLSLGWSTVKCREHPGLINSRSCAAANWLTTLLSTCNKSTLNNINTFTCRYNSRADFEIKVIEYLLWFTTCSNH